MTHPFKASNVLLEAVIEYKSLPAMAAAMDFDPLAGLDVSSLSKIEKLELLSAEKKPLKPTTVSLTVAESVYGMVRSYYRRINPCLPSIRRAMIEELNRDDEEIARLENVAIGSCLLVIKGPTGTAKSVSIARACSLLGKQVTHHGENKAAGWLKATQISYLIAPMSDDGTRHGLLLNILNAIDLLLATEFARDIPREFKTVSKIQGRVVKLLKSLYVGVLVIEEVQLKNMVLSHDAHQLQMFVLGLANSGMPLVLVGNPHGFSWLSGVSQDARRMAERETIVFHPSGALVEESDEWDTAIFLGIARYYVLEKKPHPGCAKTLKFLCGGNPGIGLSIWCLAQKQVLRRGGVTVTPEDLKLAFAHSTFDEVRDFAEGFALKEPGKLLRWKDADVDVAFYANKWGKPLPEPPPHPVPRTSAPRKLGKPSASAALRRDQKRREQQGQKREGVKKTLSAEDIRATGVARHNMASLEELRRSATRTDS